MRIDGKACRRRADKVDGIRYAHIDECLREVVVRNSDAAHHNYRCAAPFGKRFAKRVASRLVFYHLIAYHERELAEKIAARLDCFFEQRRGVGGAYGNRSIDDGAEAGFCLTSAEQIAFDNECADDSAIIAANIGCLHCQHDIFALQHVGSDME